MPSQPDSARESPNPPNPSTLFRSIAENFTGVYLTMLSIIQGVAFTDLANIAFSEHAHFSAVNWIEVATMLWTFMYVWNHFMADALMTYWVPGLEDAALLFGTGVFELVENHAILWGASAWLATLAIMFFAWAAGTLYIRFQEEQVVRDPVLMDMLRNRTRPLLAQTLGGAALVGLLSILCTTWGTRIELAAVIVTFAVSIVIGGISARFWHQVRHYAYTGEAPERLNRSI